MAVSTPTVQLTGLARKFVMDGLIDEQTAARAWEQALKERVPFVTHVVSGGLVEAAAVAQLAAQEFGVPVMDISSLDIDADVSPDAMWGFLATALLADLDTERGSRSSGLDLFNS